MTLTVVSSILPSHHELLPQREKLADQQRREYLKQRLEINRSRYPLAQIPATLTIGSPVLSTCRETVAAIFVQLLG
jgi:hypothetical protein